MKVLSIFGTYPPADAFLVVVPALGIAETMVAPSGKVVLAVEPHIKE